MLELDENGFDPNGFDLDGIHKDTGTRFDKLGFDQQGYDEFGLNKYGYTRDGHHTIKDKDGNLTLVLSSITTRMLSPKGDNSYNKDGVNTRGFFFGGKNVLCIKKDAKLGDRLAIHDRRGFLESGKDIETGTKYNKYGYDAYGYNKDGYDEYGFNKEGINEYTGTKFDRDGHDYRDARAYLRSKLKMPDGLDEYGFDKNGLWNGRSKFSKETGLDIDGFDKDGFDIDGINKQGFKRDKTHIKTGTRFNPEGFDIEGFKETGFDKDGYDRLGIDKDGLNKDTHKEDKRVTFAKEFINSGKSIESFSKERGLQVQDVKRSLEMLKTSPCIGEKITEALKYNSDKFIITVSAAKEKLISGAIGLKEAGNIENILRLCNDEEKQQVTKAMLKGISTHDMPVLAYRTLFGIENIDSNLPNTIINKLNESLSYIKQTGNKELMANARELHIEMSRIKTYRSPYMPDDLKSVGYMKEGEKEPRRLVITEDHIKLAKEYLSATNEFMCYKTMSAAFMKIARGELTPETIDKIRGKSNKEKQANPEEDLKHELVKDILGKQEHISEQNKEISELQGQREASI